MTNRQHITQTKRWVVKIGSALLTSNGRGLNKNRLSVWVDQIADWRTDGRELVIVSSGAVAEGMSRMQWVERPHALHELQAAAAIGQMGLVQAWESCFMRRGLHTAQVLLTHDDLADRRRYLNARSTLMTLLSLGVVPVVNENDAVANDELRFGDNDTLAALVANLIEADLLILLTDQQGFFDADPRKSPDARLIQEAEAKDASLDAMAGDGGALGRGGMTTKLKAARKAARSGIATLIASGNDEVVLKRIAQGANIGTLLRPTQEPHAARKHWLAGQLVVSGELILDEVAVKSLKQSGSSLLAADVKEVKGEFQRGKLVACQSPEGGEVARGLVNYSSDEIRLIMGHASSQIEGILGYLDEEELIHRDNLALI